MDLFIKILKRIDNILKNEQETILKIFLLNFLPYAIFVVLDTTKELWYKVIKVGYYSIKFYLLILIVIYIISFFKYKKYLYKFLIGVSLVFFIIEIILLKEFSTIINIGIAQIFFETNMRESKEFLENYIKIQEIVILLVFIGFISITIKFIIKKIDIDRIFKVKFLKVLLLFFMLWEVTNISFDINFFSIGRTIISCYGAFQNVKEYKKIQNNLENSVELLENNSEIKNIVLVIGESTGRNHMSVYGYKLDTTPLFLNLEKINNLYKFTDVISPHSHTIPVLKKLLTFYNNESEKEWYEYNNIIDIFKEAGYKTYWFSNQESSGVYGNVAYAFSQRADFVLFNNFRDSHQNDYYDYFDEEIVDKSKNKIDFSKKNFIIYHLMGTHIDYSKRYPKKFKKFENSNKILEHYDNAVFYNDYVVNKIFSIFKDKESIVIYLSDHGEEVYDFREAYGHSGTNASKYMIEIPFLIYLSDDFKKNYSKKEESIKNSLNNPYMTDDFINTLLDIADIEVKEFDSSKSLVNENFNKNRKRVFLDKDYDEYWKNKN